ncbi:MAG: hypothetical protein M1812_000875 [Candelaria pacifica]|nr:MAG: hypothetical protein M1812_000875 [Candelaria pacifica]
MDASDDRDVKLQRASADLLADFQRSLPKLLWHSSKSSDSIARRRVRQRMRRKDVDSMVKLLEPFQEWPQLLDPHLARILPQIVDAFLEIISSPQIQQSHRPGSNVSTRLATVSMPRAICQLLYTLCKVRGEKVISQFFTNEPKYLEPMLAAFEAWDANKEFQQDDEEEQDGPMTWYERYITLLWLSHLLLAPFDLASISSIGPLKDAGGHVMGIEVFSSLPGIARRLLPVCHQYLVSASKERESTRTLLVRLSLRPDMRRLGLLQALMHWALSSLESQPTDGRFVSIYQHIGVLSFIAGVLVSADKHIVGPLLLPIFKISQCILVGKDPINENIRSSALARKVLIKILRSITILVVQSGMSTYVPEEEMSHILEDIIDHLLTALADKETPVRYAASKALSVIATALEPEMAAEVVEAIIGSMKEDLFWEDEARGLLFKSHEVNMIENVSLKPKFSAVNPLRWHGLTLTLAQLLFRRSPSPEQLPEVLSALILALGFEQRSSTGSSIGTNVRDSACFGIWSLARRYTTAELSAVNCSAIQAANCASRSMSVLQVLATELVVAGSLDPSGNIRRGSSAALQELIGRHPDTIVQGISILQVVDYHAVALRSRSATEVAIAASKLGDCYCDAILDGLLGWRAVGSPDAESRRLASISIGLLSVAQSMSRVNVLINRLLKGLSNPNSHLVEERHGLLLSLAEVIDCTRSVTSSAEFLPPDMSTSITSIWKLFSNVLLMSEKDFVSTPLRPELTAEAACRLISAVAHWESAQDGSEPAAIDLDASIYVLSLCLNRGEDFVIRSAASAANDLFMILTRQKRADLVGSWTSSLEKDVKGRQLNLNRGFGHIAALGLVFDRFATEDGTTGLAPEQRTIIDALVLRTSPSFSIESRVAALRSLSASVSISKGDLLSRVVVIPSVIESMRTSLEDYTIDQRGDIGSWVRLAAIDAVAAAPEQVTVGSCSGQDEVFAGICRLAAEKLDKVRIRAWACLQVLRSQDQVTPAGFDGVDQVSSHEYYLELLNLLHHKSLRLALLEGYVTSAGAGSEALLINSRSALIAFAEHNGGDYSLSDLCADLVEVLRRNSSNDRVAVPAMEVLAFILFDSGFNEILEGFKWRALFVTVQKAHFKSGNAQKLEAAVKIYSGLLPIKNVRKDAAEKLVGMLLHRFAQVRNAVADALWVACENPSLMGVDWGASPRELKHDRWGEFREGILSEFEGSQ